MKRMAKASASAEGGHAGMAKTHQERAQKSLGEAKAALEKTREQVAAAAKRAKDELTKKQMALAEKTEKAAKEIEQAAAKEGGENGEKMKSASASASKASGSQSRAGKSMQSGDSKEAVQKQQQAVEELEKGRDQLVDENAERNRAKKLAGLSPREEELSKKAMALADKLKDLPRKSGSQPANQAQRAMEDAARRLKGLQGEEAEKRQKQAEEYLRKTEEELAEEERRYRELQQEELLFKIREELRRVIKDQEAINTDTRKRDADRDPDGGRLSRLERQNLRGLSKEQTRVAEHVKYLAESLEKEDSIVFGMVLRAVGDDMHAISTRLGKPSYETGMFVQELQTQVLRKLVELERVFGDELNRRQKKPPQQQGGGGQQKQPLVPPIMEVIMLRNMQAELNGELGRLTKELRNKKDLDPMDREYLERLANRQGMIKDVWEKFMKMAGVR
jgi:hypothetical protein